MAENLKDLPTCEENRGPSLLVLSWTLTALAIVTVALRVWFRRKLSHGISWDDYFIVASLVGSIVFQPARRGRGRILLPSLSVDPLPQ